ncbi:AAA15 family ATPase/GTPase [Undibacterium sp. GrIS 1.2]|uniref:AAA family ATPase n=1 Tax=Undibacterium sp. GrIS 1.2 TaxID=3143933 RepID=UPI003392A71F
MSEPERIPSQNQRQHISLKNLYLDPNNYRFIDSENYVQVADDVATDSEVQRRTTQLILGKNAENARDLLDSFRKNGFLPVDQIQVRRIGDSGKFLVVEGNRRVAILKWLQIQHEIDGISLGQLDIEIFSKVPVIYYTDVNESHHLVLMGLKHISGNKKWPAINQAELIRTLHDTHLMPVQDICQSIGISKPEVNTTLQTLALIDAYKDSDYGDQFQSDKYSIFREVIRNRRIRNWLQWDDIENKSMSKDNQARFFSWISEEISTNEDEEDSDVIGNYSRLEPVLIKSTQIRDLAKIIDDEQALSNLDTTRNLSDATLSSDVLGKDKVKNAISILNQEVSAIFSVSRLIADADRADIKHLNEKLQGLLTLGQTQSVSDSSRSNYLAPESKKKFTSIAINNFRHFSGLNFENLNRINIIAGINNAGKTTLLEAVKLLCSLNDTKDFLDIIRRRAKASSEQVDMNWFLEQFPNCDLSAFYDDKNVSIKLNMEQQSIEDTTHYLTSACFDASYDLENWSSQVHFFEKYPQRTEGKASSICPSVFSSPFNGLEPNLLRECHSKSLKEGSKKRVIDFIRQNIDSDITNIEQNDRGHFTVMHDRIHPNPDLTQFGEGLQRIFKIALLFAGAKNGVLIIDEFENAIHASLLDKVVTLLYELSVQFNVQVFISSHSKECIDAFALSKTIPSSEISAYALVKTDGKLKSHYFSGDRLNDLVQSINFDLRGKVAS